jgi:hypothetical protein
VKLLLAGGRQAREAGVADLSHRPLYDLAVLATLDLDTLQLEPWARYPGVQQRFGAPAVLGQDVLACTEREVLRYGPDGQVRERWAHPWMVDVHHAAMLEGALHVACTGLDGVMVLQGERQTFLPTWPGADPRRAPARSRSHPNHVWAAAGRTFATRGRLGDVVGLHERAPCWPVAEVPVHDGLPTAQGVWFTAVDGQLVLLDPETGQVARRILLQADDTTGEPLGWCRGLWIADGLAWVGFTRIRATRLRASLAWVRGRLRGRPVATRRLTRVVAFELDTGRPALQIALQDVELDVLMGMVPLP